MERFVWFVVFAFIFFLQFFLPCDISAQVSVSIGPKAGASFSGFRGEHANDVKMRKGLAGGIFLAISPLQFLTIQPEVVVQHKGGVNEMEEENSTENIKLGYVNAPLLLKLRVPIFRTIFPHIYAGPQFSYAFMDQYSISSSIEAPTTEVNFRDWELGGVLGAGMDVEVKHLFVTIDFRYGLSAMNLTDDEQVAMKNKDMAALFGMGYKF